MKINKVAFNNRRKVFIIHAADQVFTLPYSRTDPQPVKGNFVCKAYSDEELGKEAFTYILESGEEGAVHLDSIREYNQDPEILKNLLVYNLTIALRKAVKESTISNRQLVRQLNTSASQFYRMLDPSNTSKSLNQMIKLLYSLDCDIAFQITNLNTLAGREMTVTAGRLNDS